jgi:hypothetical protein
MWDVTSLKIFYLQKENGKLKWGARARVAIHEQVLTCKVNATDNRGSWMMSIVYGANQGTDRRRLLQKLIILKNSIGSVPWLLVGDFNVIRSQQERWGNVALIGYET